MSSTTTTTRVPAGWYPDPLGDAGTTRRWWNGEAWTEYTAPLSFGSASSASSTTSADAAGLDDDAQRDPAASGSTALAAPLAPTAHDSALAALAMSLHAGSPATSPWDALPSVASATVFSPAAVSVPSTATGSTATADSTHTRTAARSRSASSSAGGSASTDSARDHRSSIDTGRPPVLVPATRTHTPAVWIMTTMPAVHLLLLVALATRFPVDAPVWTIGLALALPAVCAAGLAAVDGRLLGEDGHLRVAPWGLAVLLPLLYLIVRAAMLPRRRSAWAPVLAGVVVLAAVVALGILLAPTAVAAVVALIV
ncbi:DUF2510 domain-containing protein [Microcella daejeonensis]|uniref:DUF2510 domain-containing protein n=1 Tax=Microcella daejeonensis TaxID=2994971 RepID=A0A9E8MK65_9MICO|nr:DUF2510 domain-containing protein [Microcella daejeonensis]WAB81042.1 DUF2510 domain-containing protein [Microcella daejeonensis]